MPNSGEVAVHRGTSANTYKIQWIFSIVIEVAASSALTILTHCDG